MEVSIYTNELLFNIKNKSHQELAVLLPDPEQRYPQEAGTDKEEDLKRCIVEAYSEVVGIISRFEYNIRPEQEVIATTPELPEYFVFYIESSERRLVSEEQALADLIFSYMTNRSLSRYYTNAGRNDLAAKDEANAAIDKDHIIKMIYRKRRPAIPTRD